DSSQFSEFFEAIYGRAGGSEPRSWRSQSQSFSIRGEDIHSRITITLREAYSGTSRTFSLQTYRYDESGAAIPEVKTLKATVPAGVTNGQKIRLRGQGQAGLGEGGSGDLFLEIELEHDRQFTVEDRDVTLVLPIAPWEAILGASVEIPTLGGKVMLNIPANATGGQKLRVKGKGLPGSPAGDQFVILKIVVPAVTSDQDRELVRKMSEQLSFNPRAELEV
ncbi:MAG: curved DNA-binding protein, partial [Gammaproteobacteria bacterium]